MLLLSLLSPGPRPGAKISPFDKLSYEFAERGAKQAVNALLEDSYGRIVVLGSDASFDNFLAEMRKLDEDASVSVIDVFIVQHGDKRTLLFADGEVVDVSHIAKVFDPKAKGRGEEPVGNKKLRLLYSSACYGASHARDWQRAGFKTVIGAEGLCATGPSEFVPFITLWRSGLKVSLAIQIADIPPVRDITDKIAGGDSKKVISGNKNLRITTAIKE
ncbi:MAG: hypothetical protein ACOYON_02745 [Fimbriimonas sp.]